MEGNELVSWQDTILVSVAPHEGLAGDFDALLLEGEVRFESALKGQTSVTLVLVHALPLLIRGCHNGLLAGVPRVEALVRVAGNFLCFWARRGRLEGVVFHGSICRFKCLLVHLLNARETAINDIEQFIDFLVRQFRLRFDVPYKVRLWDIAALRHENFRLLRHNLPEATIVIVVGDA